MLGFKRSLKDAALKGPIAVAGKGQRPVDGQRMSVIWAVGGMQSESRAESELRAHSL